MSYECSADNNSWIQEQYDKGKLFPVFPERHFEKIDTLTGPALISEMTDSMRWAFGIDEGAVLIKRSDFNDGPTLNLLEDLSADSVKDERERSLRRGSAP